MKHRKPNKRAPRAHPSALAVPSYHRILVKHGLIEKTLSIPDAYEVFLKVGADPEAQKLRRMVARGDKIKQSRFASGDSDGSTRHDQAGA